MPDHLGRRRGSSRSASSRWPTTEFRNDHRIGQRPVALASGATAGNPLHRSGRGGAAAGRDDRRHVSWVCDSCLKMVVVANHNRVRQEAADRRDATMLAMTLAPTVSELRAVRHAVRGFASTGGFSEWPLTLIVTELLTNAMAASPPDEVIDLRVSCHYDHVRIRVVDRGAGLSSQALVGHRASPPSCSEHGGRGLYLIGQLADEFTLDRLDGRTVAHVRLAPGALAGVE